MSGGALTQLLAVSIHDSNLYRNNEISDFKPCYKGHVIFSTEYYKYEFVNDEYEVLRNGDLVDFTLVIESRLNLSIYELTSLIDNCRIKIGRQTAMNVDSFSYLTNMIIKNECINVNKCYNDNSEIVYKYTIKIPFNINGQLPLIALHYDIVTIKLKKYIYDNNNIHKLVREDEGDITMSRIWKNLSRDLVNKILNDLNDIHTYYKDKYNPNIKLGCEYILLDTQERRVFARQSHDYLLENIYTIAKASTKDINNNILTININNRKSMKYLIIYIHSTNIFNPNEFDIDPIISATLRFNNSDKDILDSNIMRVYDPKRKLGKELPLGMYMISFSLHPSKYEPSGSVNFSRIDHINLKIKFPKNSRRYNVTVCGCNYNVLRIMSGMAGLKFTQNYSF